MADQGPPSVASPSAASLSADDGDAIAELFNIGMGPPAAALSEMLGEPVDLSVPLVQVATRRDAPAVLELSGSDGVIAVREAFSGSFSGDAMLVFTEEAGVAVVTRLMGGAIPEDEREEILRDYLVEIGNIILNGCLASFSNLIHGEVEGDVPRCDIGRLDELVALGDEGVMFVHIEAGMASAGSVLHVVFMLDIGSIDSFRAAITAALEGATASH